MVPCWRKVPYGVAYRTSHYWHSSLPSPPAVWEIRARSARFSRRASSRLGKSNRTTAPGSILRSWSWAGLLYLLSHKSLSAVTNQVVLSPSPSPSRSRFRALGLVTDLGPSLNASSRCSSAWHSLCSTKPRLIHLLPSPPPLWGTADTLLYLSG